MGTREFSRHSYGILRETEEAAGLLDFGEYPRTLSRDPRTIAARLLRPLGLTVEEWEREEP